jgi:hypothetical protein
MSIVVGVVDFLTGERSIGADMGVGYEHLQIVTLFPKIQQHSKILVGYVGDVATIQQVDRQLAESTKDPLREIDELPDKIWRQISMLVMSERTIFEYSDSGKLEIAENGAKGSVIGAIGTASSIAYGAAYASRQSGHVPYTNVRLALEASAQYCPGISDRYRILNDCVIDVRY